MIPNVTDKEYYTNSFHLDVREKVTPFDKIDFESVYPKHATGGFISYAEFPSLINNPEALETFWDYTYDKVPYAASNSPLDRCLDCGFEGEATAKADGFECPNCGNRKPKTLLCIRRVCGYLGEAERPFNSGKQDEVIRRVKHI